MTTLYELTLAQALANLRLDLSDVDPTNYRWSDAALTRAIDRANERYSKVAPWFQASDTPAVAGVVLYPWPAGAIFIDRVEYPQGRWPKSFYPFQSRKSPLIPAPSFTTQPNVSAPTVTLGPGGALSAGVYQWAVSYTVPGGGETTPSPDFPTIPIAATLNQLATLTTIPIGPHGTSGRNIYRTKAGGVTLYLAGSIPDNTTTIYTDLAADAALVTLNSLNTTANLDQIELIIPPELWPQDATQLLEITYATKHELDAAGTTIPERHWETLYQGALAYAMWAYLPTVNDNFMYADGHLRDRVDDTASTVAWRVQCTMAFDDFEAKLKLAKEETDSTSQTSIAHWGDKPLRYERL